MFQLGKLGLRFLLDARPMLAVMAANGLLLQMLILCRNAGKEFGTSSKSKRCRSEISLGQKQRGTHVVSPPVINPRRATGKELMILEEQTTVLHHRDDRSSHLIRFRRQWARSLPLDEENVTGVVVKVATRVTCGRPADRCRSHTSLLHQLQRIDQEGRR
jgi:hypothetical protein